MEVLIDRQAIEDRKTEQPWRYYDLGHGLCSYEFSISVRTAWLAHVATFTFRRNRPAPTCSNRRLE
ncbi:MAG: hypothetical protein PPHEMADMSA_5483 [uncultured Paraburkholderia sp.]|nr:MAG: hypothetical protein PPHEMADMSA_5483 [uncultured Paraburkholderia sp.]